MEPAAGQPASESQVPYGPVDVAVPREHLPGHLPARNASTTAFEDRSPASFPVAHRAGSPESAPEGRAPSAAVRAADADHPPAAVPAGRARRGGTLGG